MARKMLFGGRTHQPDTLASRNDPALAYETTKEPAAPGLGWAG
jgi:hypothetical protein